MATRKPEEKQIVRESILENNGIILMEQLEELGAKLPRRTAAAIKKKYLEQKQRQVRPVKATRKWTEEEEERLVREYRRRREGEIGVRINAIMGNFPERTAKAIATKLREKYSETYYMRNDGDSEDDSEEEREQSDMEQQSDTDTEVNRQTE